MKILITGSNGLVGSEAMDFFRNKGWEVFGVDNNQRAEMFGTPKRIPHFYLDIRDQHSIENLFATYQFDAIVHAAAQPSHDWAKKEPLTDFDINARGTLILLEAMRKITPKATFVYVSTDKVYGENMSGERLSDESLGLDFAGKRSLFGCSKTAADIYVQEYGNYFCMKTVCFRPGCITGKNHKGAEEHGFLSYLAKCIKEGIPYKVFGDGSNVRDQIHSHDVVNAFYQYIENPHELAEVYNLGGGLERSVSVLEAIKLIEKETGKKCNYSFHDPRIGDRLYDVHDVSKFRKDYSKWDYKYSLSDIIKDICYEEV